MSLHARFKRKHGGNAALGILISKALPWNFYASFSNPAPGV